MFTRSLNQVGVASVSALAVLGALGCAGTDAEEAADIAAVEQGISLPPSNPRLPEDILRNPSLLAALVTTADTPRAATPNRNANFVVAGAGDSYGAGEGAPVERASSDRNEPTNLSTMWGSKYAKAACHRSDNAPIVKAFERLQNKYPGAPMKLVFKACSGAEIKHLINDVKGDEAGEATDRWLALSERPQLEQIEEAVEAISASAEIDVLALSIGGNDAGFGAVVGNCIGGGLPENLDFGAAQPQLRAALEATLPSCATNANIAKALAGEVQDEDIAGWPELAKRYARLIDEIDAVAEATPIRRVLISHYAAGLRDEAGQYCSGASARVKNDLFGFIDRTEAKWLHDKLIAPLNLAVNAAVAEANGDRVGPSWKAISAHTSEFFNHGSCSSEPWTHYNNSALALEGNNFPDYPGDSGKLRILITGLLTAVAATSTTAAGCLLGPAGCLAGAGAAQIVGAATALNGVQLSSGMAHPNVKGYAAVTDALFPELEQAFKQSFSPLQPDRLRQYGAAPGGRIVLRWDDLARSETRYELEVYPLESDQVLLRVELPANRTEYTHNVVGGFVGEYRVRACSPSFCSGWTRRVKATNLAPGVPLAVSAIVQQQSSVVPNNPLPPAVLSVAGSDPKRADTGVKLELTQLTDSQGRAVSVGPLVVRSPSPFEAHVSAGGADGIPLGRYRVRAASCNVFGCSNYSAAVESVVRAPIQFPSIVEELPPSFQDLIDRHGQLIPLPKPAPRPTPRPDPSQP